MVMSAVCGSCSGVDLTDTPLGKALGLGVTEPDHCYGTSDRPAPPGVLGGYRCSCDCRKVNDWPRPPLSTVPFDETGARERAGDGLEGLEW